MFGFTGTPIFAENAVKNELGTKTTKELFGECLHKYVITDAIRDENVLKFSVEYVGRYKNKDSAKEIDIQVEDIDIEELMESDSRLEKIVDYVLAYHNTKTHNKEFTAFFCVSSIPSLIKYYELFQRKKMSGKHDLKIATIFSFIANENDADANGLIPEEILLQPNLKCNILPILIPVRNLMNTYVIITRCSGLPLLQKITTVSTTTTMI